MHSKTIEVRAFRGTLNVDTYFASIQFMLVMKHIANTVDNVVNGVSWRSIVKLAKLRGYDELIQYLDKKELLDSEPVSQSKNTLVLDDSVTLMVMSNGSHIRHYMGLMTKVRFINIYGRDSLTVTPISVEDKNRLSERCGAISQVVFVEDLSVLGSDGYLTPLSKFDLQYN
jgi:hypothetical protein